METPPPGATPAKKAGGYGVNARLLVFDFNISQALLCFFSVMYGCNVSLFHRDKILNLIQARLFHRLTLFRLGYLVMI